MSYRTIWIYYCVAAAVAIALYAIVKILGVDCANEMWITVWGTVICANMYAIKMREEERKR